jgi:chloramphenicol 3-O-phosphotransferase
MHTHALLINGVPAAGKTTVANAVRRLDRRFQLVDGDKIVRGTPYRLRLQRGPQIWADILDGVDRRLQHGDTLLDFTMTASQVIEARARFMGRSTFVILRIDEATRAARQHERDRRGNRLGFPWQQQFHSMPGADELYDLVLAGDTSRPIELAQLIVEFVDERTSHVAT